MKKGKHLRLLGRGSTTFILMRVYSCGPTPSPVALSWSILGWPSSGENMVCLGSGCTCFRTLWIPWVSPLICVKYYTFSCLKRSYAFRTSTEETDTPSWKLSLNAYGLLESLGNIYLFVLVYTYSVAHNINPPLLM